MIVKILIVISTGRQVDAKTRAMARGFCDIPLIGGAICGLGKLVGIGRSINDSTIENANTEGII